MSRVRQHLSILIRDIQEYRNPTFSPQGKIALQFLKSYTGFLDKMLLERINADYQFRFFCGVEVNVADPLENFKLLSEIRTELGLKLDIGQVQKVLAGAWGCYMSNTGTMMEDATCYETYMRYPTDAKLLWEANEWIYKQIKVFSKAIKKRKTRKQIRKRIKSLLYLLGKLLGQLSEIEQLLPEGTELGGVYQRRLSAITTVLDQQQRLYEGKRLETGSLVSTSPTSGPSSGGKRPKGWNLAPRQTLSKWMVSTSWIIFRSMPSTRASA